MFKTDALGMSQGRKYVWTSLGRHSDIFEKLDKLTCFCFLVVL